MMCNSQQCHWRTELLFTLNFSHEDFCSIINYFIFVNGSFPDFIQHSLPPCNVFTIKQLKNAVVCTSTVYTCMFGVSCSLEIHNFIVVSIHVIPCENFYEISPRSRRDLGENRGEIAARFWPPRFPHLHGRDRRNLGGCGKSRRPKTRRDLAAILAVMREISAAKNAPRSRRDSRRDAGNLGGQKRAAISPRSQRDMEISAGKYAARCCSEIAARYGNLGGQNAP